MAGSTSMSGLMPSFWIERPDGVKYSAVVRRIAPPIPAAPAASTDPDEPPKEAVADYQLLRALDLIRGISLYSNRAN